MGLILAAFVGALAALGVSADGPFNLGTLPFWIVSHAPLLSTRLDPLISPGGVSGHTHQIIGSSSFAPIYDYNSAQQAQCTTANIAIDHSNYWMPQLYRKDSDNKLTLVSLSYANTYYQTRRTDTEPVYEFPPGFRMLAGNPTLSTFNASDPAQQAIRYACLGVSGPETNAFPAQSCPDGLRAEAYFPHCWDGVHNWLEGSAHVSYGAGQFDQGGQCPSTHPYRIMGLFYEFIFEDDFSYVDGARVWATGDTVGYSLHGDFTNGWPQGFFQKIFDQGENCAVGFGLNDCAPLAPYVTTNGSACAVQGVRVDEDIGENGGLSKLPGNNPLWGGSVAKAPDPNYVETAKFISVAPTLPSDWAKIGCIAEVNGRALTGYSDANEAELTPTMCMSICAGKGFSMAGVEYGKECYCGNTFSNGASATLIDSNKCDMVCPGADYTQGYCGGPDAISLYKFTGTGTPTVVNGTSGGDIQPSPTNINMVLATVISKDTINGDPDYPSGNMVTTLAGGQSLTTASAASSSTGTATNARSSSAVTSGTTLSTTVKQSITSTGSSATVSSSTKATSSTAISTATGCGTGTTRSRRVRSGSQAMFDQEEACVMLDNGKVVCGIVV